MNSAIGTDSQACLHGRFRHHVRATGRPFASAIGLTDWGSGRTRVFDFGADHVMDEMVFVPRPGGTAEDDGWLVGPTLNLAARATECPEGLERHIIPAGAYLRLIHDGPLADIAKGYAKKAEAQTMTAFLLNIIPTTLFSAFVTGDLSPLFFGEHLDERPLLASPDGSRYDELLGDADASSLNAQLAQERDHFVKNLHHPNAGEGIAAFLEKRAPRYE